MKLRIKTITTLAACALGFFAATDHASAVATIAIDVGNNGTFDFIIADGSALDSFPGTGTVTYMVPTSTGVLSVTTGITKPSQGSNTAPKLALNQITGSGPAGVYGIYFSETGFGPTVGTGYYADLAFNPLSTGASITYDSYSSASNTLFALSDLIATMGFATGGAGALIGGGNAPAYVQSGSPFSLTQKVVVTLANDGGTFGATANITSVPVPDGGTSVALLGLSLLGLHGIRRKLAKA